jgi:predicted enzyme related to lactoylglutathione lyase
LGVPLRLQHVSIPFSAEELESGRVFYREIFGLEEIPKPVSLASEPGIWFALGDQELHLFTEEGANVTPRRQHFCFAVENLDTVRQRIEDGGFLVKEAVEIPNRPRLYCYDPAGNRVEVTEIQGEYR